MGTESKEKTSQFILAMVFCQRFESSVHASMKFGGSSFSHDGDKTMIEAKMDVRGRDGYERSRKCDKIRYCRLPLMSI